MEIKQPLEYKLKRKEDMVAINFFIFYFTLKMISK